MSRRSNKAEIPFKASSEKKELVTKHRLRLVSILEDLTDEQWDQPTLCEGWRVREVVGHLLTPALSSTVNTAKVILATGGYGPGFDRLAREFGAMPTDRLVGELRANAGNIFVPPTMGAAAPLTDVIVHTQDITRPLRIEAPVEATEVDPAITFCVMPKSNPFFVHNRRLKEIRLEATDHKWKWGKGEVIEGPILDLLLAVLGRRQAVPALAGDGLPMLLSRI